MGLGCKGAPARIVYSCCTRVGSGKVECIRKVTPFAWVSCFDWFKAVSMVCRHGLQLQSRYSVRLPTSSLIRCVSLGTGSVYISIYIYIYDMYSRMCLSTGI